MEPHVPTGGLTLGGSSLQLNNKPAGFFLGGKRTANQSSASVAGGLTIGGHGVGIN